MAATGVAGFVVGLATAGVLGTTAAAPSAAPTSAPTSPPPTSGVAARPPWVLAPATVVRPRPAAARLPLGGRTLPPDLFFVAYYGTAGTGSLGVLGEASPERIIGRLRRAAAPYAGPGRRVQPVFELIVSIADRSPGPDRDFSHDLGRAQVARYVRAAHRLGVLLVLDVQPGRSRFLPLVRRWAWALRDPWVGLALDPEWRVRAPHRPAEVVGHSSAAEIDAATGWLARLVRTERLPQKLVLVHQFRREMVPDLARVRARPGLVLVQHVDGFGTRQQKLATYHHVARPGRFRMGFKLFYDEDRRLLHARDVLAVRPRVSLVSYQ